MTFVPNLEKIQWVQMKNELEDCISQLLLPEIMCLPYESENEFVELRKDEKNHQIHCNEGI